MKINDIKHVNKACLKSMFIIGFSLLLTACLRSPEYRAYKTAEDRWESVYLKHAENKKLECLREGMEVFPKVMAQRSTYVPGPKNCTTTQRQGRMISVPVISCSEESGTQRISSYDANRKEREEFMKLCIKDAVKKDPLAVSELLNAQKEKERLKQIYENSK